MTSDAVLVLPEEVLPQSALPAMRPDPLLLRAGSRSAGSAATR